MKKDNLAKVMENFSPETTIKDVKDICVNCKHSEKCAIRNNSESTIWFCDEYECEEGVKNVSDENPKIETQEAVMDEASNPSPITIGLCVNCHHKKECTHKKTGGIWHCEDYE